MSLGRADGQGNLLNDMEQFCDRTLADGSIYSVLHRERDGLFPDGMFADLFSERGRRSVPPSVVATVMVLQRLEGLSDREAVERYAFDTRWRYAAGVGSYDCGGWASFAHTVLVDMRARLSRSQAPRRIFEVTLETAREAGLVGASRVLDSTPLYDAVATMDTITLIRSAIRGLLKVAGDELGSELEGALSSGDDYASNAKPRIDWDDEKQREALINSRAKDGYALLCLLDGRQLDPGVAEAAALLASVLGQDLETGEDGNFRIARRVAKDRVISTVDPEARHGHKTSARGFDGYKGHIAMDPDSEIITDTEVSAGNVSDGAVAPALIEDLLGDDVTGNGSERAGDEPATGAKGSEVEDDEAKQAGAGAGAGRGLGGKDPAPRSKRAGGGRPSRHSRAKHHQEIARTRRAEARRRARKAKLAARDAARAASADKAPKARVYGDAAYGSGAFLDHLADHHIDSSCKVQPPVASAERFTKDAFTVDLEADTVTCPNQVAVTIHRGPSGDGVARFAGACAPCALASSCTDSAGGRSIRVGRYEHHLAQARTDQAEEDWARDYRATRPKVERKLAHLMRRRHGGRRARLRGRKKVDADFNLLAAAQNLARLATLGLHSTMAGWALSPT